MRLQIFVAHPSALLTDHRAHGDGLVAFGFIRELAARGHELHVAAERVDLHDPLPANVTLHVLGARRARRPTDRIAFMWRMRRLYGRLARGTPFDLVHQLNPVDVGLTLALEGLAAPIVLGPYVPDWPADDQHRPGAMTLLARRLREAIRAAQQRRATSVLLSTPAAATKLAQAGAGRLQVHELSPGIDIRTWTPGAEPSDERVLFLANLHARKGILDLLDAFALMSTSLPGARLIVAGDGPLAAETRRRVRALPHPSRVELLGSVTRADACSLMQACSVYCLPSLGEPFGMTALEAMACAKPVVATAAGGLRYLVTPEGGRTVAPGDAPALAAALEEILRSPRLARAMGEHNRREAVRRYSWERVGDRLEEAYRAAIAPPRRHP